MDILHPGKDSKGRFLPGHRLNKRAKKYPTEVIEVNPHTPFRDTKGQWFPGFSGHLAGGKGTLPLQTHELRQKAIDSVQPGDIEQVMKELLAMCLNADNGRQIQLQAMTLFFDRVFGKATQQVQVDKQTVETKINVDYSSLTDSELCQMQALVSKISPEPHQSHQDSV